MKLREKTNDLNYCIKLYENTLCKNYLKQFQKETKIKDSSLNDSLNIEFYIQIKNTKVRFTYDFLKKNDPYVWFGAEYPLTRQNGEEINTKKSDELKTLMENNLIKGYKLVKSNNSQVCIDEIFKCFYSDKNWFYKYCEDNQTAIKEIKEYIETIRNLKFE